MKLAILTDTHFGVRNDSPTFLENQRQFYEDVFFPTLIEREITHLVHGGDVFDRRKGVNFATLASVREFLFDRLAELGIEVIVFVGNHDVFYKNTNAVNSVELLLPEYDNITMIRTPTEMMFDGTSILLCPWISHDSFVHDIKVLKASKARALIGHFEINGFMMHRDTTECKTGLSADVFDGFEIVLSGHFHEPSSNGTIWYLGAPSEYTWSDYDCRRGFNILDTDTLELEHIRNPNPVFYRYLLDADFEVNGDWSFLKDKIVRVIVGENVKPKNVEKFIAAVSDAGPDDFEVIDNTAYHLQDGDVSDEALATEDTVSIVNAYVDSIEDDIALDPERLKTMFGTLHVEALALQ